MRHKKIELLARVDQLEMENGLYVLALNACVERQFTWFRKGSYQVGIARINEPCGGVVLVRYHPKDTGQKPYTFPALWEKWYPATRDAYVLSTSPDGQALRSLAFQIHEHVTKERSKAA